MDGLSSTGLRIVGVLVVSSVLLDTDFGHGRGVSMGFVEGNWGVVDC